MKLLCDENIPLFVSNNIASKTYKVTNVAEEYKGISDQEVFNIAFKNKLCILTADHHFDRFKQQKNYGIVRLSGNLSQIDRKIKIVLSQYKTTTLENTYIKINNGDYKVEYNRYHKNKRTKKTYKF